MNKKTTKAIVLKRVDYGDSDRIITILTPDLGKVSLIAKGVRKIKSKLAGGIELFSILDAGYVIGRGEVGRLTSARLDEYYSNIINDIERVQLGYQILKTFDRNIEDSPESDYFYLLCQLLRLLNESAVGLDTLEAYFKARFLAIAGHGPNLNTDSDGNTLKEGLSYEFNTAAMSFYPSESGPFKSGHIKLLRLLFSNEAQKIFNVQMNSGEDAAIKPLIDAMFRTYLSV